MEGKEGKRGERIGWVEEWVGGWVRVSRERRKMWRFRRSEAG